jgi:hypothetical protein
MSQLSSTTSGSSSASSAIRMARQARARARQVDRVGAQDPRARRLQRRSPVRARARGHGRRPRRRPAARPRARPGRKLEELTRCPALTGSCACGPTTRRRSSCSRASTRTRTGSAPTASEGRDDLLPGRAAAPGGRRRRQRRRDAVARTHAVLAPRRASWSAF